MTVFFDTSVIVPALVDQLSNHAAALEVYARLSSGRNTGVTSTHALAECYSVLTGIPLPRRVTAAEAKLLVNESVLGRLTVVDLAKSDYVAAIERISRHGLVGGIVYDALHAISAEKAGCTRLYTYNVDHFRTICADSILVSAP